MDRIEEIAPARGTQETTVRVFGCFTSGPQTVRTHVETLAVSKVTFFVIGMRNAWDMATFVIMRGNRIDGWSG